MRRVERDAVAITSFNKRAAGLIPPRLDRVTGTAQVDQVRTQVVARVIVDMVDLVADSQAADLHTMGTHRLFTNYQASELCPCLAVERQRPVRR